ncbi:arginyltransferase [Pseudoxanthomonas composti]|uniref:Aspartate/glutamate leucyltransferase n=1 Tax=Pseudoxanthomonas composti TaxID=2137479 RepID=A0A4Q1JWI9_9GAMM|nr:arginyltransferase [Pseudoxanthomonas composti]RXR05273.1 arginyltransferase [Pseudoxanthomonas composti]
MGSNALPRSGDELQLFHTGEHPCGYWPNRTARDLVLDPRDPRLPTFYPTALEWGFRKSGNLVYRPHCQGCRACVPVRIDVNDFHPDRSQRRALKANARVETRVVQNERTAEHLALYQRYLASRHAGGGMDTHGAAEFEQFLVGSWSQGRFLELREDGRLIAVAVTDLVPDALSAVYTFFEPELERRSLGTLAILRQIEWARRDHRRHLYLGYWIQGHRKMDYKRRYRPLEYFDGRRWQIMPVDADQ